MDEVEVVEGVCEDGDSEGLECLFEMGELGFKYQCISEFWTDSIGLVGRMGKVLGERLVKTV